jgi:hypothetical protein
MRSQPEVPFPSKLATRTALGLALGALCASAPFSALGAAKQAADLVVYHGKIHTVDEADSTVEAIAVSHGVIIARGTDKQMLALAKPDARRIDFKGRAATPGLIDTHAHVAESGVAVLYHVRLGETRSVADAIKRVKAGIEKLKPGEWLQGDGWDEGKFAEHRYITAAELDAVSPNNPVWLEQTTGHYGVANSLALRQAHIVADTKDPPTGTIDRDAAGKPTGVLKEKAQMMVRDLIPPPTPEQRRAGILASMDIMHREGMTGVKDPLIDRPIWDAYEELAKRDMLGAHVCVLWDAGNSVESARKALAEIQSEPRPPQTVGDGRLVSCGAKIFMDGSGGGRTAWVSDEWHLRSTGIDKGNRGYPAEDPEVYRQMVQLLNKARVHIGTHAVGDHAIDWVVDTYAKVLGEDPVKDLRHSIIHANIPTDHALAVMADLQQKYQAGYPELQAPFMWWIGDNYAGNFGPERSLRLEPLKSLIARHILFSGGSDNDVTPLPARYGIWASVVRETLAGTYGLHPFGTAEAIDVHAALKSYTAWAAPQLFLEKHIGSLEVGKQADLAVWASDPYTIPSAELKDLRCELTLFGGKVVYDAEHPKSAASEASQ